MSEGDLDHAKFLAELSTRIEDLPREKFLPVVEQLDAIASIPGVAAVLERARRRLKEERPPRPPKLMRLACMPFEDLLTRDDGGERADRISRSTLMTFWKAVAAVDNEALAALEHELHGIGTANGAALKSLSRRVWAFVSKQLATALDRGGPELPNSGVARTRIELIRDTLAVAEAIDAFKCAIPETPLERLDDVATAKLMAQLKDVAKNRLPVPAFLTAISARLANPAELFVLFQRAERIDTGLSGAETGLITQVLAKSALNEIADATRVLGKQEFVATTTPSRPEDIVREADRLVTMLKSVEHAARGELKNEVAVQARTVIETVRNTLTAEILEPATRAITASLDTRASGPEDAELIRASEAHARALRQSRQTAGAVGLGDRAAAALEEVRSRCIAEAEAVAQRLASLDQRSAGDAKRQLRLQLNQAVRLVELAVGAGDAQELFERIRQ